MNPSTWTGPEWIVVLAIGGVIFVALWTRRVSKKNKGGGSRNLGPGKRRK